MLPYVATASPGGLNVFYPWVSLVNEKKYELQWEPRVEKISLGSLAMRAASHQVISHDDLSVELGWRQSSLSPEYLTMPLVRGVCDKHAITIVVRSSLC